MNSAPTRVPRPPRAAVQLDAMAINHPTTRPFFTPQITPTCSVSDSARFVRCYVLDTLRAKASDDTRATLGSFWQRAAKCAPQTPTPRPLQQRSSATSHNSVPYVLATCTRNLRNHCRPRRKLKRNRQRSRTLLSSTPALSQLLGRERSMSRWIPHALSSLRFVFPTELPILPPF